MSSITAIQQLQTLSSPPNNSESIQNSLTLLSSLPIHSASKLPITPLLEKERSKYESLEQDLAISNRSTEKLVSESKLKIISLLSTSQAVKNGHDELGNDLVDFKNKVISTLSQRENGGDTLRERLAALDIRKRELEGAKNWFAILAGAETIGLEILRSLQDDNLEKAFENYIAMVDYVLSIHSTNSALDLTKHMCLMTVSTFASIIKHLSARLAVVLEALQWPKPIALPNFDSDVNAINFKLAFTDLLKAEELSRTHPLPLPSSHAPALLAISPLITPLMLRFNWHFSGERTTNRIDKPEYPLAHVLNLIASHTSFLTSLSQLTQPFFPKVEPLAEFITLLLPLIKDRLIDHLPQLMQLPSVLAHTVYSILEFDGVLRGLGYSGERREDKKDWEGIVEVLLGEKEVFTRWLEGEREFFDGSYSKIISNKDAWIIISQIDFESSAADGGEMESRGVRPSYSALAIGELSEGIADRYKPLPFPYSLSFLLNLHLPLLSSYVERLSSRLDAFESISFGNILPGGLVDSKRGDRDGGKGLMRLLSVVVSSIWMVGRCETLGEDTFFLALLEHLKSIKSGGVPVELRVGLERILQNDQESLFVSVERDYLALSTRAEELIVKLIVREVSSELKGYLGLRWDIQSDSPEEELAISPILLPALSIFSHLLSLLTSSLPPFLATKIYRRVAAVLSNNLYHQLITNRTWSQFSAQQLKFDFHNGFLLVPRDAKIPRGIKRGWELLEGAIEVVSLKAGAGNFSQIMRIAFDDAVDVDEWEKVTDSLAINISKREAMAVMRRRPECWK